ncbi:hypothetical protein MCEMSE18_00059 [Candidatus Planktophila versatilis]|uniref:hypothetical protein n=1 Tax=Candidatus Planktophila versatilis TaxID=1884905 RepID=UPI003BEF2F60
MSTKTTFKRVALVAVAALGLGVLATAPSQATVQASSLTLSSATSTQFTSETSTASAAVATLSFLASNVGDTVSVTAYLMSAPAGNTVSPILQVSDTVSATIGSTIGAADAAGTQITGQVAYISSTASTAAVSAKLKVYMNQATKVGAYVVKLVPAVVSGGGVIDTTGVTLTITVSQNPTTDTVVTSATSIITTAADTTTATDVVVTASKSASTTTEVAYIKVTTKNANSTSVSGESYTAVVTGPGLLGSGPLTNSFTDANQGRAITVKAGDVVAVYPDGASGVSTITISAKSGAVLATETITFFGDVATLVTTVKLAVIGGTSAVAGVLNVKATDSAGTNVSGISSFGVVSSDTTKIATVYATSVASYDATTGLYTIPVTPVAAGSANLTVTTNTSSTDTTGKSAAAVAVRVGSKTPAAVTVTLDKASYAPGEKATLTVALADATALDLVGSETYTAIFATGGITSSQALGQGSADLTGTGVVSYASGGKKYTIYMPIYEGDVIFSWTTGSTASAAGTGLATANQAVAGTFTATVSSASGSAAIDAANEATDAANAATDAALAAADAADAATAAAEDASAAVATLAKSVNTALANLKKQITALTALVNKLLKK